MKFRFLPHIAVQLSSRAEAVAFYRDIIGMDIVDSQASETKMRLGEVYFYIEESEEGKVFLAFEVDDLTEARSILVAHGATIYNEGEEGFMVKDPYGMHYYLSKPNHGS
jgi:catechol 2,3-dioxygenase-like lactoylglutathione lyase family enzyme